MTSHRILVVHLEQEKDVVLARQRARQLAESLGFDGQDQTRIATAVSEIARNAHDYAGGGSVEFSIAGHTAPQSLEVHVRDHGAGVENVDRILRGEHRSTTGMGVGLRGAERLMDRLNVDSEPGRGTTVVMSKFLPAKAAVLEPTDLQRIADRLVRTGDDPLQELRRQNHELMLSLELVRSQQQEMLELKQQAEAAGEAKAEFLASMSHEIRTPLNGIIGYTERLMGEELTPEQRWCAERVQAAGSMLLTLVNDILDFSQIEARRIELDQQPFSLKSLIDDAVSIISGAAEDKGLPIRLSVGPALPDVVIGDEPRVRQVLLNLLSNAVKFTPKGHVSLAVEHSGRSAEGEIVRFSITDTGIGIPPEKRGALFQRFAQVDLGTRRQFGGTGLGLAISKNLVNLMGGEIGLSSEEGQGSTFWFQIALPTAPTEAIRSADETTPEFTESARILVAEDLEMNQELVRWILENAGHQVDVVADGAEAVAAVEHQHYDLVLMDIRMPHVDGLAATRMIRALDPPARDVPIVAMTANVMPQQVRAMKEAGIERYIGKPMKQVDLLRQISAVLSGTRIPHDAVVDVELAENDEFDARTFEELENLLGSERMAAWIGRMGELLEAAFDADCVESQSRERLGRLAHDIVSNAGAMGFNELSQRCMELEEACLSGGELSRAYEAARSAAQRARNGLARLDRAERKPPGTLKADPSLASFPNMRLG